MRLILAFVPLLLAADWPRFLGPAGDNSSAETGLLFTWPADGPRKLWDCPLGQGYAPPVVAAGRLYHADRHGDSARLTCREAATGKVVWTAETPTKYEDYYGYDGGPRCCPVVDGPRVYVYTADGVLLCHAAADGKELWKVDTKAKYRFHQNFFGVGSTPVVEGDLVIAAVGGSPPGPRPVDFRDVKPNGTALVGFDKLTGEVRFAAGDDLASYSSPTVVTLGGRRVGLYLARGGLLGFDPKTGKIEFRYPWRSRSEESVNAANPVVAGETVFVSECYGVGSACLKVAGGKPTEVWTDRAKDRDEKSLLAHWNTPVHHDGHVYGSSGRHTNEADLRCVELATGAVKWTRPRATRCTLLKADGHFLSLGENGELRAFKATPARYEEVARWESPDLAYPAWAPPVLSDGRLYVRGKDKLVCYALTAAR